MSRKRKKNKKNKSAGHLLRPKYILYLVCLLSLSVGFVFSRMRGVELQYKVNKIVKKIDMETHKNKQLKAKKADLLSVKNLKKISKKFNLKEPSQKQIIVISNE